MIMISTKFLQVFCILSLPLLVYLLALFIHLLLSNFGKPTLIPTSPRSPHKMSTIQTNSPLSSFEDFLDHGFTEVSIAQESCDICLHPFRNNDPAVKIRNISGCCHIFGRKCISVWLASNNTCPLCRAVLIQRTVSPPSPSRRRARVFVGNVANAFAEAFNPRSTSTGDLVGMHWVDLDNIIESDDAWNRQRAYRRVVREQHRRRMALELRRQWRERNGPHQEERFVAIERVGEAAPALEERAQQMAPLREEREESPAEAVTMEAVFEPSEGFGEVLEPPTRRRAFLERLKMFVNGKLSGRRR
jgi:hypothetical protein